MMNSALKKLNLLKPLRKSAWYGRLRQYLPMTDIRPLDDRDGMHAAEVVTIDWPSHVKRPRFGIVKDYEPYPRWTKYCRFFENNLFEYGFYDIHAHDWVKGAEPYDIIVGIWSCYLYDLQELRDKYYFLETHLGKRTYPSTGHALLYEDKRLEAYLAELHGIPFAKAYVSYDRDDALRLADSMPYPVISKIIPSSGSMGMELVRSPAQCRKIVERVFSRNGRKSHVNYFRQKNSVYFQEYIPNDGYDIRVIVIGERAFGYYRRVLPGDFRASGMGLEEKRALPFEAMQVARRLYKAVQSPMLAVDMVHGLDGQYRVIEYSPVCQVEYPDQQLQIDGVSGAYVFEDDDTYHFQKGVWWPHELSLREFLLRHYLPTEGAGFARAK